MRVALTLLGNGVGGGLVTGQAGLRDGAAGRGLGPGFRGPRGEARTVGRCGPLPGLAPASRPEDQPGGLFCVGCCLPGLSLLPSPIRARSVLALFLWSPLSPHGRGGTFRPPHSPRRSAGALAPSPAPPWGRSPPRVGTARGKQKAEAAGANARFSELRFPFTAHWEV